MPTLQRILYQQEQNVSLFWLMTFVQRDTPQQEIQWMQGRQSHLFRPQICRQKHLHCRGILPCYRYFDSLGMICTQKQLLQKAERIIKGFSEVFYKI